MLGSRKSRKIRICTPNNLLNIRPPDPSETPADAITGDKPIHITLDGSEAAELLSIASQIEQATRSLRHKTLLNRAILTGLVGQFEVLFAETVHEFYRHAPKAIETDEKVFSLNELLNFDSTEEAVDFLIERRTDDLLRGSLQDWQKFLQTRLKIDITKLTPDWHRFSEYIQRRHIIVHAGGKITRRYIANVAPEILASYFGSPEIGKEARLTKKYIARCLEDFEVTGLLLGYECILKFHKAQVPGLANHLSTVTYDCLLSERWETGYRIADWGSKCEELNAGARITSLFNRWLCAKHSGRWAEAKPEVQKYDCSALNSRFALARHALLEDENSFFYLLEVEGASLDRRAWTEWPVFSAMRKHERFSHIMARIAPALVESSLASGELPFGESSSSAQEDASTGNESCYNGSPDDV